MAAQGNTDAARNAWQQAAAGGKAQGLSRFYQALAVGRLGRGENSVEVLADLTEAAAGENASANDYYLAGLAERFRLREEQAQNNFRRALELEPSMWQARIELERAASGR